MDYGAALDRLSGWGVRINPTSRLQEYAASLRERTEKPSSEAQIQRLEELAFDLCEIREITEIIEAFDRPPSPQALEKLRWLPKGKRHPDETTSDSRARDLQYELALYTLFRERGIPAVLGEPDVTIHVDGRTFPVEAKRPGSPHSVARNVAAAVRQAGKGGIAAVSLDHVIRPRYSYGFATDPKDVPRVADLELGQWVKKNLNPNEDSLTRRYAVGGPAAALLITFRMPVVIQNEMGWMHCEAVRRILFDLPGKRGYESALQRFGKKIGSYAQLIV